MITLVRPVQPTKASLPTKPTGKERVVRDVQFLKEDAYTVPPALIVSFSSPVFVTLAKAEVTAAGSVSSTKFDTFLNAVEPTLVTPAGISSTVKATQSIKLSSLMLLSVLGKDTEASDVQPLKAAVLISVTPSGISTACSFTQSSKR